MNIKKSQKFWKYYLQFKKYMRLVAEISSFAMLIMSFEKAFTLQTWSVVQPWQVTRLAEKFPRLLRTLQTTFAAA